MNRRDIRRFIQGTFAIAGTFALVACTAIQPVTPESAAETPLESPAQANQNADLNGLHPQPVDAALVAALEEYIADAMARSGTPGLAIGVVQNGEVVYQKGFGVREVGKPDPVTPGTLMMIGSTGKSMTTMMLATVVDDGLMSWETPVIEILPWFALNDPELTPKITMRHLVCNCTGLQRRDMEIFFTSKELTAQGVVQSLSTFALEGTFGETFGYINQMVATGGYAAATAAGGSGDLYADYVTQMQSRVFDPIGMSNTTFSFEQAQTHADLATPYGITAEQAYVPISLEVEQILTPNAPAGGSWSNIEDMTRYVLTQLNQGVAPDGTRIVSTENLTKMWEPAVQASPTAAYGMGWGISHYKGTRVLAHGGGTSGFSSFVAFIPEANLGVVVLTNAGQSNRANILPVAVGFRVFELVLGQPMETDARLAAAIEADDQAHMEIAQQLLPELDAAAIDPYLGVYSNEALGEVTLNFGDGTFLLDAGEFTSTLRPIGDVTYVLWDPPLSTTRIELTEDDGGQPQMIFDPHHPDAPILYSFAKVQ